MTTTITNPSHTLVFGDITMIEEGANPPDSSGVVYNVMSQDTTFGNPAPVTVALISLMRQGSLVSYDHTENREPVLRVVIEAATPVLLAQGEQALQLECEKANTLTWIPPNGGPAVLVSDSFNRTNNTGSMGSADTGQAWTLVNSGGAASAAGIISNTAYLSSAAGIAPQWATIDAGAANATVQVTMTAAYTSAGLAWRYVDNSNMFGMTKTLAFKKVSGSQFTVLTFSTPFTTGDTVKVVVSGDNHEVFRNGVSVGSFVDANHNTATKHGLTWSGDTAARFEDFSVFTSPSVDSSIFDVVWSSLELVFDDAQELMHRRTYLVHLQALPHARAEDLVVTTSQPVGTLTVVDTGSSTTGWSAVYSGSHTFTLTVVSGKVTLTDTSGTIAEFGAWTLTRTGSVSLTGNSYLVVDGTMVSGHTMTYARINGIIAPVVSAIDLGGGATRWYYRLPASVATATTIDIYVTGSFYSGHNTFAVDQVQISDGLPFYGTARQKALAIIPGGSVRAQGTIAISHASNALGKTIVYSSPSGTGYQPPLRGWLNSSSAVTADATTLSGGRNAFVTPTNFRLPVNACPVGRAEVWAWVRNANSTTIRVDTIVSPIMGTTRIVDQSNSVDVVFVANVWQLVFLGAFTVPPSGIGPAGLVQVSIARGTTAETPEIDEAYLFGTHEGVLTIVDCGTAAPTTGGASNRLWIDAPTPDQPQGGVWRGNAADRSDAWHAGSLALPWQIHDFHPLGTSVFVATSNTLDASTSLEHYKRFHTHVARDS